MKVVHPSFRSGWRRLGVLNIILASLCGLSILAAFSFAFARHEGKATFGSTTIDQGQCDGISRTSIILHILINIVSTGVLASSNFFMQIVTSPTRKEVDYAHMFLRPLDIGLPSWKNLSSLPRFKRVCWLLLFLSSIPIHLFFNSAIYKTAYQGDHYNLVIATRAFTHDEEYWLPGASLAPAGASSPVQILSDFRNSYDNPVPYNIAGLVPTDPPASPDQWDLVNSLMGYGSPVVLEQYWNKSSGIQQTIQNIAQQSSKWDALNFEQCMDEYRTFSPLSKHSDLLIIVSSGTNNPNGWQRDQVFKFDPRTNLSEIWNSRVPPEAMNSLWYWTNCSIHFYSTHKCAQLFGLPLYYSDRDKSPIDTSTRLRLKNGGLLTNTTAAEKAHGYTAILDEVEIESCLARPVECQVLVSSGLLLIVLSCVLVKITTCITILWYQQDASLITLGDAIESFISKPDIYTRGLASLDITDSQNLQCSAREIANPLANDSLTIRPRRWRVTPRRLRSTITRGALIQVYFPTSIALVGVAVASAIALQRYYVYGNGDLGTFGPSENVQIVDFLSDLGYYATLIAVNTPQLILSFVYLIVNMLHTQLQVEREWNSYALAYKPLRVSFPQGKQISTYRLQLPYKYSIPLMSASAALHWTISNCLFLMIVDGTEDGYNGGGAFDTSNRLREEFDMPESVYITAGYSITAILTAFVSGTLFILSPLFFSSQKLIGDMTFGATNSLVLSAACHVPRAVSHVKNRDILAPSRDTDSQLARNERESLAPSSLMDNNDSQLDETATIQSLLVNPEHDQGNLTRIEDDEEYLIAVSRLPLRWGVTSLPSDLKRELLGQNNEPVMHLSFGTEDHDVVEPQFSSLYA